MTTLKIVSDLICPWCYIGKRRMEDALRRLPSRSTVSVSWFPFQLNPHMPPQGMNRKEYCMRKFGSWDRCEQMYRQIAAAGKSVGLDFRFDQQSNVPNTFDIHRVIWLAGRLDCQDAVVEALFRAYFCDGVNLSDRYNLIEVAESGGVSSSRLERFLDSDEGVAEVSGVEHEIKMLGVASVPLFVVQDRVAISGAQPAEALLKAFEDAAPPPKKPARARKKSVRPPRTGVRPSPAAAGSK